MVINTTQVSPNYQSDLKSESSAKVNDLFENIINKEGNLNVFIDESELKDLSYEEAKELRKKLEENSYLEESKNGDQRISFGSALLQVTNFSNDDDFNKTLFETMKTKEYPGLYFDEIKHNIEYEAGNRQFPWPTISVDEAQGNYTSLSNDDYKNLDIEKFLENIIETYTEMLLNLPSYLDREETEETLNNYKELQKDYQEKKDEKNALLENLTKNNKENPLLNIE
ncbi:MAG: hypothetical protein ACNI25_08590 [Halarcobacter sp.]